MPGNGLLADTLRDLTARTSLIAMRYQSSHDAAQSCEDHVRIVAALERGDITQAEALMAEHIGTVQAHLRLPADTDPLAQLRDALAPMQPPAAAASTSPTTPSTRGRRPAAATHPSSDDSTYLGALL